MANKGVESLSYEFMIKPNFIPRTLKGVGGVRLFDIPGVIYPTEILRTRVGMDRKNGKPYDTVPSWGISTREASELLKCSLSATRACLYKNKVTYRLVAEPGNVPRLYWKKSQVEQVALNRLPVVKESSTDEKLVSSQEALKILQVGRSSLYRYAKAGRIHEIQVRQRSEKGLRRKSYFLKAEINRLAAHLNAVRIRNEELKRWIKELDEEM